MLDDLKMYFRILMTNLGYGDEGQALVEYALILALVSVVAIAILTTLGGNIITTLTSVANAL